MNCTVKFVILVLRKKILVFNFNFKTFISTGLPFQKKQKNAQTQQCFAGRIASKNFLLKCLFQEKKFSCFLKL